MKLLRAIRQSSATLACAVAVALVLGQAANAGSSASPADASLSSPKPPVPLRAFPSAEIDSGRKVEYLGMFASDGFYRKLTGARRFAATHGASSAGNQLSSGSEDGLRPSEVPNTFALRCSERMVYDTPTPGRVAAPVKPRSALGNMFGSMVKYAWEPEDVFRVPVRMATNSGHHLIVTDPGLVAVHVLDPEGKDSFRIVGGKGSRIQSPDGVAVDAADNIYVADSKVGMVLVYAPDGRFLRYIGTYQGENIFEAPGGVAIDRAAGHLFVLDTPRHRIYVLDLQGNVLQRMGKRGGGTGPGEFTLPTQIVVTGNGIAVLDSENTRVQWFDADGKFLRELRPRFSMALGGDKIEALAADDEGNLYMSSPMDSFIRVFSRDGRLLSAFGSDGTQMGEFRYPAGIWLDSPNQIYIADTGNRRVQVFKLTEKQ